MTTIQTLESELEKIKTRNNRVEKDKAWETSWTRRIAIAVSTYVIVLLFFLVIKADRPYLIALVPSIGFLLSTLTIDFLKYWWLKKHSQLKSA